MRFVLIILTVFFITGCGESKEKISSIGKSKSTSEKDIKKMPYATDLIPNHAIGIMTINPTNISIKTALESNVRRTLNILNDAGAPMEFDSDDYDYDLDLMLDAINFSTDMFAYMYMGDGTGPYFCVSMDIKSSDAFEDYITKSNQYAMFNLDIKEKEKYNYTQIEGGPTSFALAWDDKKALFITGEYLRAEVRYLFELNNKLSNNQFDDLFNITGDVGLWIDNSRLMPYATEIFTILSGGNRYIANDLAELFSAPSSEYLENSSTGIKFFFNKEGIRMEFKDYTNDFVTDINNKLLKKFDSDILTYIPNKSLLSLSLSLDFKALYESPYMDEIWTDEGISQYQFEAMFEEETDIDFDELISTIGGSVVINFSGITGSGFPELTFAMNHNNKTLVSKILRLFVDMRVLEKNGDYYMVDENPPLYIAYNENTIVGSFDRGVIKKVKNEDGLYNNLSKTDIGNKMDDSFLYAFMNLDLSDWPSEFGEEMRPRRTDDRRIFNKAEKMLESVEVIGPYDESSIALKLNMDVKEGSPLIDLIDFGLDELEKVVNRHRNY